MTLAFGRAPVGAAITQPVMPSAGVAADPGQMNMWQKFQQRLSDDPNLRMALLTTGLNMLRTPQPGQSGFDVFANAAGTGVNTLDQLRQRDRAQEIEDKELTREADIDERRTTALETQVSQTDRRLNMQGNQFTERMDRLDAQLQENRRQFNERVQAGDIGNQAPTTGAERMIEADIEALVSSFPEIYTDDEAGRAKARLRAREMGTRDANAQARLAAGFVSDMMESNVFLDDDERLTTEQIVSESMAIAGRLLGNEQVQPAAAADALDGSNVGEFRVVKIGEDQCKLTNAQGQQSNETYTSNDIRVLQNSGN